ncbi:ADP-ribosyltransferase [Nocardia sp. NPDC057440]|uniref:ADP-ribosyltransferase n=1 Tax=Nocardia sp. NPDC057440 TaxID=3346134 RepID=UPI00366DF9C5
MTLITEAAGNYATILQQVGYNYELAEHTATIGAGDAPTRPAALPPPVYLCRIPLPSAGGSGGLVEALKLVEAIGITVPDGNATKLTNMASTWRDIAAHTAVAGFVTELDRIGTMFDHVTAPELAFVAEDLRHIREDVQGVVAAANELAASCQSHRESLDALREALKHELETLGEELIKELAITYAIGLAASALTFGIGVAVASARAVQIAAKFGKPLRLLIESWKSEKNIAHGVDTTTDIAKNQKELQRLKELGAKGAEYRPPTPKLTDAEFSALTRYTANGYKDLNEALRSGRLTEEQAARVRQLNEALDKYPNYEGPVVRRTTLPSNALEEYNVGTTVTEAGFTSTSRSTSAAFDGTTEFQIVSKTGKNIEDASQHGPYSGRNEQEVLFKPGTKFNVIDKFVDPATMRTVIRMVEA